MEYGLDLEEKKKIMLEYLKLKIHEEDWHGVADCAMDLRDIENYENGFNKGSQPFKK